MCQRSFWTRLVDKRKRWDVSKCTVMMCQRNFWTRLVDKRKRWDISKCTVMMCQRNFWTRLLEERKGPVTLKIIRFDGRFIQLTSVAKIKKYIQFNRVIQRICLE